jgi:hypothetical protein
MRLQHNDFIALESLAGILASVLPAQINIKDCR